MRNRFLICSSGRTGSHILVNFFLKCGVPVIHIGENDLCRNDEELELLERSSELAVHYHGKTFIPNDPENWTLIVNYRKDLFDQCCSHIIARHTNEYVIYDKIPKIFGLHLNSSLIIHEAKFHYDYVFTVLKSMVGTYPWKSVVFISFEEITNDHALLFEYFPQFKHRFNNEIPGLSQKSSYPIDRCILSYKRRKKEFKKKFFDRYGIRF